MNAKNEILVHARKNVSIQMVVIVVSTLSHVKLALNLMQMVRNVLILMNVQQEKRYVVRNRHAKINRVDMLVYVQLDLFLRVVIAVKT